MTTSLLSKTFTVYALILLITGPAVQSEQLARKFPTADLGSTKRLAEVRNHDAAFALLIETFQQLQTSLIEADYQDRIFAADQIVEEQARHQVFALAQQERELRLAKLARQLEQMTAGYEIARRDQEPEIWSPAMQPPPRENTADRLKEMVVFLPDTAPHKSK